MTSPTAPSPLTHLDRSITACERCPRLRKHCLEIARTKRRAFQNETYWGKPIVSFGDPDARILVVGLAPAAHGANRTGRIFTGDRSGDWLYRALHKAGFANQSTSVSRDDGLQLHDVRVTCVVRCAPPDNKPLPIEIHRCSEWLRQELLLLPNVRVIIALGKIALDGIWPLLIPPGSKQRKPEFRHGGSVRIDSDRTLILSFHPSQQNTFTGRLTEPMFDAIFSNAQKALETD